MATAHVQLFSAADVFGAVFDHESIREIPFAAKWANGTGYYDNAATADLGLKSGEVVKSTDDHGRKILIIGCGVLGNIAVFQRYIGGQSGVYVANAMMSVERIFDLNTKISDEGMARLFGQAVGGEFFSPYNLESRNAGRLIEGILDEATPPPVRAVS